MIYPGRKSFFLSSFGLLDAGFLAPFLLDEFAFVLAVFLFLLPDDAAALAGDFLAPFAGVAGFFFGFYCRMVGRTLRCAFK